MWYPWRWLVTLKFHRIQVLDGTSWEEMMVARDDGGEAERIASRSFKLQASRLSLPAALRVSEGSSYFLASQPNSSDCCDRW